MKAIAVLLLAASTAAAAPWADRCRDRIAKAKLPGKVTVTVTPANPGGPMRVDNTFGAVDIVVDAGPRKLTARIGEDKSGHRHRGMRGLADKRYEDWHSPYADSRDGDAPPKPVFDEERHHRLTVGVLLGTIVVDGDDRLAAQALATAIKPVIEACTADVTPDEADPSLAWTTKCLADMTVAQKALAKREPTFGAAACKREPFDVSCGKLDGTTKWNAMTTLGGEAAAPASWRTDGTNRMMFHNGDGLVWATADVAAAKYQALFDAFRAPLETCSQLMRKSFNP